MNLYNTSGKRLNVHDFQHPADKQSFDALLILPGFEKATDFLSKKSMEKFQRMLFDASYIHIKPEMSPRIQRMFDEAAEMYATEIIPDLYLQRSYNMSIISRGIETPYMIYSTALLEQMSDKQLFASFSSQFAGIQAEHSKIRFIEWCLPYLGGVIPGVALKGIQLAINAWRRNAQYTYDRAILLATENFDEAVATMFFGDAPADIMHSVEFGKPQNAYHLQANEFINRSGIKSAIRTLETVSMGNQWNASRYMELYQWYIGGDYVDALEGSLNR